MKQDQDRRIANLEAELAAAEARKHVRGLCGEKDCDLCEISQERLNAENQRDAALARVSELERTECKMEHVAIRRVAALEEALRELLETTSHCNCEEAYTDRGLHAPDCYADEPAVAHARRCLEGKG